MKKFSMEKNKIVLMGIISLVYFVYVAIFIKPWVFKSFSLVDDGQVLIQNSSYFKECIIHRNCSKFVDQTFEFSTGRVRPSYWITQDLLYQTLGNNPELHHVFRVFVVGYISVMLLALVLLDLGVNWKFVLLGSLIFATNFSFSENIIRLGPNEPFQVIFLALFSLLYLRKLHLRKFSKIYFPGLVLLLVWTVLIKETNLAVILAIVCTEFLVRDKKDLVRAVILVGVPSTLFVLGAVLFKKMPSTVSSDIPAYVSNYLTDPADIVNNALANIGLLMNSMSPFLKMSFVLLPLLFFSKGARGGFRNKKFFYWFFLTLFFTAILFPWRYVLERYQLIAIFAITVVTAYLLDRGLIVVWKLIFRGKLTNLVAVFLEIGIFFILINLFFRGLPVNLAKTINYRDWYSVFTQFEEEQVAAIAIHNEEVVLINGVNNINNWEWLYEIPIHLKFIYSINPKTQLLDVSTPREGKTIFSRTAFDSTVPLKEIQADPSEIVESKFYRITQIDPLEFRNRFFTKPVSTLIFLPISNNVFEYYWEIRKIER